MKSGLMSSFALLALLIPICGCGSISAPTPAFPTPSISISPTSVLVGSSDIVATVVTSNFPLMNATHKLNLVIWSANGADTSLRGKFVSPSQLTVVIPADLLSSPVTAKVRVELWDDQGDAPLRTSPDVSFVVSTVPSESLQISSLAPNSATAGSSDITLTIMGSNFVGPGHKINLAIWSLNGKDTTLSTTFVSSTQLTALVPASLLGTAGTASVRVEIWDKQGDVPEKTSNLLAFTINP